MLSPTAARMKTAPARLHGLDTLRSLAMLVVMLFHLEPFLPASFGVVGQFGWMGVDLFFVLSGFLIGTQLLKPYLRGERASLLQFYQRRAFRILPAYLVVVFLYFTVPAWRESPHISPLWMFLTFTQNLFIDYSISHAFSFAWSLCVEEHFYLVLPLLLAVMMRKPSLKKTTWMIAGITAVGIAIRCFMLFHELRPIGEDYWVAYFEHIYYPTYAHFDGLVAGVTLALIKSFRPAWWAQIACRGHALLAAGVALVGLSLWLFADRLTSLTGASAWGTMIGFPLLSVGLVMLVASSISDHGWLSRFAVPGAKTTALLAYSLYLTHKEIAHLDQLLFRSITEGRGVAAVLLYAVTCTAAAALLYLCVERPFMRLRERTMERSSGGSLNTDMQSEPAL